MQQDSITTNTDSFAVHSVTRNMANDKAQKINLKTKTKKKNAHLSKTESMSNLNFSIKFGF